MPWRREGSLGGGRLFYASRVVLRASGAPYASRAWLSPSDVDVHAGDAVVTAAAVVYYVSAARGAQVFLGGYGYPLKPPANLPVATKQTSQSGSGALGCVRIGDGIEVDDSGLVSVPTYSPQRPDVPSLVSFGGDASHPSGLGWYSTGATASGNLFVSPKPYSLSELFEPGEGVAMSGGSAFGLLNVTFLPQVRLELSAPVPEGGTLLRVPDGAGERLLLGEDLVVLALAVSGGAASTLDVSLDASSGTLSAATAVAAGTAVVLPPTQLRRYPHLILD